MTETLRCMLKKTRSVLNHPLRSLQYLGGFTNHLLMNRSTFSEMYLNTVISKTLGWILMKTRRCYTPLLQKPPIKGMQPRNMH